MSWLRAFWTWLGEAHSNAYRARKERQEKAKREMEKALGYRR